MKRLLIISLFIVFPGKFLGQAPLPILKSGTSKLEYQIDKFPKRTWNLNAKLDVDILAVDVFEKTVRRITFFSDSDSISFDVQGGKDYDFLVEKDGVPYHTRISGKLFTNDDLRPYVLASETKSDAAHKLRRGIIGLAARSGSDETRQYIIDQVRGCADCSGKLDLVYIGYSRAESSSEGGFVPHFQRTKENAQYLTVREFRKLKELKGINSVRSILIQRPEDFEDPEIEAAVDKAEVVIFENTFAPCKTPELFRGTRLSRAIKRVFERGGGVSGSVSAQGSTAFGSCLENFDVRSDLTFGKSSLGDPYFGGFESRGGYFDWPFLKTSFMTSSDPGVRPTTVVEMAFAVLARQIREGKSDSAYALIPFKGAIVTIDKNGLATVAGNDAAYFILADHRPEVCEKGKPLTYSNFKIWKLAPGRSINLRKWPKTGYYTVSVNEGKLSRDPY